MSIFFPPPPPFMGGAQPYAPIVLDPALNNANAPPYDRRAAQIAAEVVHLAQPPAWPYEFVGGRQPYGPLVFSSGIPGQSIDPPPRLRQDLSTIFQAWTQAVPAQQLSKYQISARVGSTQGYIIG
jgi:hypothetical protein